MSQTIEQQVQMFDFPVAELDAFLAERDKREIGMIVMSMLSDVQEMVAAGLSAETIRRTLNRAKYFVDHIRA